MEYRDGDGRMTVIPPGNNLPSEQQGFDWVDTRWRSRRRGRKVARTIQGLTGGLTVSTQYNKAAASYERSRQELDLAREQAALVPLKIARERQRLEGEILQGQAEFSRALQEVEQASELSAADHQIAMLERRERTLALKAKVKERKRELKRAGKPRKPRQAASDAPEEFRRAWATESRVRRNRSEADRRIDEIYDRAKAERRALSADEIEEIDALQDSAEAAENEVRRRAASGLS